MLRDCVQLNVDDHRVLLFRPRASRPREAEGKGPSTTGFRADSSPVPDLSEYEGADQDDDFRHRMTMNALAFAYVGILVVCGVWLASNIAGHCHC